MNPNRPLPTEIKIAAYIHSVDGIWVIYQELLATDGSIEIVTIVVVGWLASSATKGLLQLSAGWRTYTLVICWLAIAVAPIVFFTEPSSEQPMTQQAAIYMGALWVARIWQCWVLTRPPIRKLFKKPVAQ